MWCQECAIGASQVTMGKYSPYLFPPLPYWKMKSVSWNIVKMIYFLIFCAAVHLSKYTKPTLLFRNTVKSGLAHALNFSMSKNLSSFLICQFFIICFSASYFKSLKIHNNGMDLLLKIIFDCNKRLIYFDFTESSYEYFRPQDRIKHWYSKQKLTIKSD